MTPPMTGVEAARTPGSGVRAAPLPTGVVALLDGLGAVALLTRDAVHAALRRPPEWSTIAEQLEQVGWRSLSIVNLTAFFTGMVLALQLGTYMARFGVKMFVSRIVGMALVRELGPVLTALMIGGRVGAGITAELGTMAVTDQIDAIRALGASPIRNLVVPRLIAVLVMLPVLTIIGDLVGIPGGLRRSPPASRISSCPRSPSGRRRAPLHPLPRPREGLRREARAARAHARRARGRDARRARRQRLGQERALEAHERAPHARCRRGRGGRRGPPGARRGRARTGAARRGHALPAGP